MDYFDLLSDDLNNIIFNYIACDSLYIIENDNRFNKFLLNDIQLKRYLNYKSHGLNIDDIEFTNDPSDNIKILRKKLLRINDTWLRTNHFVDKSQRETIVRFNVTFDGIDKAETPPYYNPELYKQIQKVYIIPIKFINNKNLIHTYSNLNINNIILIINHDSLKTVINKKSVPISNDQFIKIIFNAIYNGYNPK